MSRNKKLFREYWGICSEGTFFHSKEKHDEGSCLACRLTKLCFKKNKILYLDSLDYKINYVHVLAPIWIKHKSRRKSEKLLSSLMGKNFKYKNLEDFKKQQIDLCKTLCMMNNAIRSFNRLHYLKFPNKELYYYFFKKDEYGERVQLINFSFCNKEFLKKLENELFGENEEDLFLEEETETTIINRKRIRLGLSSEIRKRIYQRDNYTCHYCGWQNGILGRPDKPLTLDHITPQSFGGSSKDDNLVTCCFDCNVSKNDKFLPLIVKNWIWNPKTQSKDKHFEIKQQWNELQIEEKSSLLP